MAEQTHGGIEKGKNIGPSSNVGSGIGSGDGVEQNAGTEVNGAIRGGGEAMPKQPPAARWIRQRSVIRMLNTKKMAATPTSSSTSKGSWVEKGLGQVNLD
jgi:hypothetical protein